VRRQGEPFPSLLCPNPPPLLLCSLLTHRRLQCLSRESFTQFSPSLLLLIPTPHLQGTGSLLDSASLAAQGKPATLVRPVPLSFSRGAPSFRQIYGMHRSGMDMTARRKWTSGLAPSSCTLSSLGASPLTRRPNFVQNVIHCRYKFPKVFLLPFHRVLFPCILSPQKLGRGGFPLIHFPLSVSWRSEGKRLVLRFLDLSAGTC